MAAVRRLARQESAGMTGTLMGNTRQVTTSADDLAEGVVRRLLRRGPRPPLSLPQADAGGGDGDGP